MMLELAINQAPPNEEVILRLAKRAEGPRLRSFRVQLSDVHGTKCAHRFAKTQLRMRGPSRSSRLRMTACALPTINVTRQHEDQEEQRDA
jgi:hypothetical protein